MTDNPFGFMQTGLRPVEWWVNSAETMLTDWEQGNTAGGFKTGLTDLDKFIRIIPTQLTVIAGRPSMGKTVLAWQIAMNVARTFEQGSTERVAVFSAEMHPKLLLIRQACGMAQIPLDKLEKGLGKPEEYKQVGRALGVLNSMPLWLDDKNEPTIDYMTEEIARVREEYDIRLMMMDYAEMAGDQASSQEQRLSAIVGGMKRIAQEFEIPVILVSQLNRDVERRADKMPQLSDMRYSGKIEQTADRVLLLMRPQYYRETGVEVDTEGLPSDSANTAYVTIAKNRNSPRGIVPLYFDGPNMKFADLAIERTNLNA